MRRNKRLLLVLLMLAALVLVACGGGDDEEETPEEPVAAESEEAQTVDEGDEETPEASEEEETPEASEEAGDIVETAIASDDFNTLVAAVEAADLVETLQGDGPFTVFAPTDEAFAAALDALGLTAEELLGDTETLTSILLYHVVEGAVPAEDVIGLDGESVATVNGASVSIAVVDGGVVLNDSVNVVTTDVEASNGIIHVIDGVLLPPVDEGDAEATPEATEDAGMEQMDAEGTPEADMEMTEEADMEATEEADMGDMEETGDVVETAVASDFTTLVAAVQAADLVETLQGPGPFTVFAPTDDAFAAALDALGLTAEELLADTETLTSILLYHVVEGAVPAEDVIGLDGESVVTVNGASVSIAVVDGGVVLNDSVNVVLTDVAASNGVIHAIDGVLLPPADGDMEEAADTEETADEGEEEVELMNIVDTAFADGNFVTLLAAVNAADLSDTLAEGGPFTVFAPTNDAFTALLESLDMSVGDLLTNTELLTTVLTYHVVEGEVPAEVVVTLDGQNVATLGGEEVSVAVVDGGVVLNDTVNVVATDVMASNGIIHVIDGVLVPPSVMEAMSAMDMEAEETPEADMDMEATEEAAMEDDMDMASTVSSACLVTDQGGVNDGTFNELAANAINQANEDFGIEISIIESNTPTDFEPNINTCLDSGAGAVVTVGFLLADATLAAAEANPDVFFIGVDQFFVGHPENLVGLQFREDQSGFLAGALAALVTESGSIGGVYGEEIPPVIKFRNGFEQGARYVNADITTLGAYIPSFIDPQAGQDLAEALIGEGADVIFGAGGATGSGGISFAAGEGISVIGVDQDEYFTTFGGGESPGAENILTSAIKRVDVGVYNMLASLVDGSVEWQGGGLYILDATNGGVGLAPSHDADVSQEVLDTVAEIEAMLADGSLSTGVDGITGALLEGDMDDMEEDMDAEATEEAAMEEDMTEEMGTIVDLAVANEDLSTLVTAVTEAGYVELLSGEGPFTVFAPSNAAFDALPEGVLDTLLSSPISLQSTLAYHVVDGALTAEDVVAADGSEVMTLLERPVTIEVTDDGVVITGEVNSVTVVTTDIMASNGIIHVIDGILLPAEAGSFMGEAPEAEMTEEADMDMEATEEAAMEDDMDMVASISSACLVTDQGGVNDGTFNELAANAINQANEDFGIEISIIESNTPTDFEPNINTCLDSGAGAVVTVGFLLADATLAAAETNPDVFFIGVDQFFIDHPENLVGLQFREDQSGFLAGALAALVTENGVIAGVYGEEIPPVIKFRNGFEQGARYVNEEIGLLGAYIPSFIDGEAGQELAEALIGEGADVIFGAGGATGSGGISFAASEGVSVIGVDQDEYFTTFGGGESPGAENILTSAIKRVDVGVYNMLASLVDGSVEWQGGSLYILDATNGGVGLAPTHDADIPQEVIDAVAAIEAMLADGSLSTGVDGVTGALLEE